MLAIRDKSCIFFFLLISIARFPFDPLHDKQLSQMAGNWDMSAFLPSAMFPFPVYQFSLINKCRTHENSSKSALCGNHGNIWVARMIWDESVRKPEAGTRHVHSLAGPSLGWSILGFCQAKTRWLHVAVRMSGCRSSIFAVGSQILPLSLQA
jgi:hypothetical protein